MRQNWLIQTSSAGLKGLAVILMTLFILLLVGPVPTLAADPLTESSFSESLLKALNETLAQPLTFPLDPADPALGALALDLSGRGITQLRGIEHFSQLRRLNLDYNRLTSLSGVRFPDTLRFLSLAHNGLSRVDDLRWPASLVELNLRNNRLSSPLGIGLPQGVTSLQLDNNFLTSKIFAPSSRTVTYGGNFIYEARTIQPAALMVKDMTRLTLNPGEQRALPFIQITSSTNPNNPVPPALFEAFMQKGSQVATLNRQEYRFNLQANQAGTDVLTLRLKLTDYQRRQYETTNQSFYLAEIPVTVWQSSGSGDSQGLENNGDPFLLAAIEGRSNHAVVDMTRFPQNQAGFNPGLLSKLAEGNKNLILTQDFGHLTLDSRLLKSLVRQAASTPRASVLLSLENLPLRQPGTAIGAFSDKGLSVLPYRDFFFQAHLKTGSTAPLKALSISSPLNATLLVGNQGFNEWDFAHLTAFKEEKNGISLMGGQYQSSSGQYTFELNGPGRYGLATRPDQVKWMDLAINEPSLRLFDGSIQRLSPSPLLYQGVTMVPARAVFEAMGANVRWMETSQTTVISFGQQTYYIKADATITGSDLKPYILNGRMLVPLRYLSSEIGASVLWWPEGSRIRIIY